MPLQSGLAQGASSLLKKVQKGVRIPHGQNEAQNRGGLSDGIRRLYRHYIIFILLLAQGPENKKAVPAGGDSGRNAGVSVVGPPCFAGQLRQCPDQYLRAF